MSRLLLEEERISSREKNKSAESSALVIQRYKSKIRETKNLQDLSNATYNNNTKHCTVCGQKGHWKSQCRFNKSEEQSQRTYYYCKKTGHIKSECRFLKVKEAKQLRNVAQVTIDEHHIEGDCFLDTGTTNHIKNN